MPVGAEDLVAGKDEEIAIDRLHVDRHMRDRLRAVDEHAGAMTMRDRRHLLDRHDRSERVGDLRDRHDARTRPEQSLIFFENHLAGIIDGAQRAGVAPTSPQNCCQGTMLA